MAMLVGCCACRNVNWPMRLIVHCSCFWYCSDVDHFIADDEDGVLPKKKFATFKALGFIAFIYVNVFCCFVKVGCEVLSFEEITVLA